MPANEQEVFHHLRADENSPVEIDMLTYALFGQEKQEWCVLFEKQKGRKPKQSEIDAWISGLTDWRFAQMRQEAVQFFDTSARDYLADEMTAAERAILESTIIREVKAAGGFWRQLSMQLITAILAPLLIGLIIVAALFYDRAAPTASSISERFRQPDPAPQAEPPR